MRQPDWKGIAGEAWRLKIAPEKPDHYAALYCSLIYAPQAHMHWSWHLLSVISLRDIVGVRPAHKLYPEAEYELGVYAIHPDHPPDPDKPPYEILQPHDVRHQFHGVNAAQAMKLGELCTRACVDGHLVPDSDFRSAWGVARRTLGCYYVGVFQGDYERQEVALLAQSCAETIDLRVGTPVKFGVGLIGKAFELGEIVNVRDVSKEPNYEQRIHTTRSEVCVPIRVGDHCVGILDAQAQKVGAFSADDLMTLETIARFLVPVLQTPRVPAG